MRLFFNLITRISRKRFPQYGLTSVESGFFRLTGWLSPEVVGAGVGASCGLAFLFFGRG